MYIRNIEMVQVKAVEAEQAANFDNKIVFWP